MTPKFPSWVVTLMWLLTFPAGLQAQFTFITNNGSITITGCTSTDSNVVIPAFTNGFPVTSIGAFAFFTNDLTGIEIPDSVTFIDHDAFDYCTNLTQVVIGDHVTSLGDGAFYGCTHLTRVVIGNQVPVIRDWTFAYCYALTNVTLGNRVINLAYCSFYGCTHLVYITIPASVVNIASQAFSYYTLTSLRGVFFQGNAPAVVYDTFFNANNTIVYCLPGTTNWNATLAGRPVVLWNPQIPAGTPDFGVRTNRFGFNVTGTTNIPIIIEGCTDLTIGVWNPLLAGTMTNGSIYFSDATALNLQSSFYRIRSP